MRIIAPLVTAAVLVTILTTPASASTDKVVGNGNGPQFWFPQSTGDCEEAAFDTVYGEIKGTRMHEATVITEAQKLGVMGADTTLGSSWPGLTDLAKHYGIKLTLGSHTTQTLEKDLAAGDKVIAAVNAETIWEAAFPGVYVTTDRTDPDHALVVDSIDETTGMVTLTDSGPPATGPLASGPDQYTGRPGGAAEVIPLAIFRQAWAVGGYQLGVVNA